MSSTQIDFSPFIIDRKQNITSWPTGDVTHLTRKEQSLYRRRKSALIEYFQSNVSVAEISTRHHLPQRDSLEALVIRCLTLHEDGQPWGFRALVPGVQVMEQNVLAMPDDISHEKLVEPREVSDSSSVQTSPAEASVANEESTTPPETTPGEEPMRGEVQVTGVGKSVSPPVEETSAVEETHEDSTEVEEQAEEETEALDHQPVEEEATASNDEAVEIDENMMPTTKLPGIMRMTESAETTVVLTKEEVAGEEQTIEEPPKAEEIRPIEESTRTREVTPAAAQNEAQPHDQPAVEEQEQIPPIAESAHAAEKLAYEQVNETDTDTTEDRAKSPTMDEPIETEIESVAIDESTEGEAESPIIGKPARILEPEDEEIAKAESEQEHKQVTAVDTTPVPAAVLEPQEKADRTATLAETETAQTSTIPSQTSTAQPDNDRRIQPYSTDTTSDDTETVPTQTQWEEKLRQSVQVLAQSMAEIVRQQRTLLQAKLKHSVARHADRQKRPKPRLRWLKIASAAVLVSILVVLAIPLCVGLMGYSTYNHIKSVADDGVTNLLSLKEILPANKNDLLSALNAQKLAQARTQMARAQDDFLYLQDLVNRPDIQSLLQRWAPQYSNKLDMARHLIQVALDVSRMGQELIGVAQIGTNVLHGGTLLSSNSQKPLLTTDDINTIEAALVHAQYYITDIQTQTKQVNLATLPFGSPSQKAQLTKYLNLIPQAQGTISQIQELVGPVSWLLGVGHQRRFLVQTLDRAELRPSGGFEGQYGILTVQDGRMGPLSLRDITLLDYAENGNELGNHPPAQYKWIDFGNFGVRDANLSADYPTNARFIIQLFQAEGGGPVDGDIQFTPVLIEQLLQMTGPLQVKEYNETITAQNLEDKLHAYQQNYTLIGKQQQITGTDTHSTRKAFTSLVGSLLLARAKSLKMNQLLQFGKIVLKDLQTRDLQIYFTNPTAEQWLMQNGYSGAMPRFTNGTDGFMVVQANISISKATQFVHSTFNDQVTLDANGGATHNLQIILNYHVSPDQQSAIYGNTTYADYMRVYAPANAQFLSGNGFDSNQPLCKPTGKDNGGHGGGGGTGGTGGGTGQTNGCSQYNNSFPDETARYCPNHVYTLGYDGMLAKPFPIDSLSGPTQTSSDLPGYQMWGGLTLTPINCISTITLSWYVPNVEKHTPGQPPYQMILGHQAGWPDTAQISVDASALRGVKNFSYNQTISTDTLIALPARPLPHAPRPPATPTPVATPTAARKKG